MLNKYQPSTTSHTTYISVVIGSTAALLQANTITTYTYCTYMCICTIRLSLILLA